MTAPTPPLSPDLQNRLRRHLSVLYPEAVAARTLEQLETLIARFRDAHPERQPPAGPKGRLGPLGPADAMVITYGDQIRTPGESPLRTLDGWLRRHLRGVVNRVHILPFYPYSSDDGFSVIDYRKVDPALGDWSDVEEMAEHFRLMFDGVINHVSAGSAWFQGFLRGEPPYRDYFLTLDTPVDVSGVTRPRTHPVLTAFETATGPHKVWTTFSTDQIDLNFENPQVLLEILDVLLLYVARGADCLRLDAIGYLWKTLGTRCIHLPQTHEVVKLMRTVFDAVAPEVLLITETNVPHADNVSYFGDGHDEAQLVYNFSLAPLVLDAFRAGSARHLRQWATGLAAPSADTTFFNFLASHDGIGVMPAAGILSSEELDALVQMTLRHGGRVNEKTNSDGSRSPYELNITLFDALSDPFRTPERVAIDRFMTAQSIMLAMAGMPGIYVHSLVGSSNDLEGLSRTGHNRAINRKKWRLEQLEARLSDRSSRERKVLDRYAKLLRARASSQAFHPNGAQEILDVAEGVFALARTSPAGTERVFCLHNVSDVPRRIRVEAGEPGLVRDLLTGTGYSCDGRGGCELDVPAFGTIWLAARH